MVALRSVEPAGTAPFEYAYTPPRLLRIAEPAADPLTEADLSTIWAGQRFPPEALATPDGHSVNVIYPGRPNFGAGPDFRDAVLQIDGRELRGDVELHV